MLLATSSLVTDLVEKHRKVMDAIDYIHHDRMTCYSCSLISAHAYLPNLGFLHLRNMASGSQGMNVSDMIKLFIKENKVMVFSKSYCPYCLDAKDLLNALKISYKSIELDQDPLGYPIQDELSKMTGRWTVPNIFINGKSIGGCDELNAFHTTGQLEKDTCNKF